MIAAPIVLAPESIEALADALAARLREPASAQAAPALLTAAELAQWLGVDAKTVYRRADELGAIRVGRALRFDRDRALAAWSAGPDARDASERSQSAEMPAAAARSGRRGRASSATHCQLLPVGSRNAAADSDPRERTSP